MVTKKHPKAGWEGEKNQKESAHSGWVVDISPNGQKNTRNRGKEGELKKKEKKRESGKDFWPVEDGSNGVGTSSDLEREGRTSAKVGKEKKKRRSRDKGEKSKECGEQDQVRAEKT